MAKESFLEKLPSTVRKTQLILSSLGLGAVIAYGLVTGIYSKQLVSTFGAGLLIAVVFVIAKLQKYEFPFYFTLFVDGAYSVALGAIAVRTMEATIKIIKGFEDGFSVQQVLAIVVTALSCLLFALIVVHLIAAGISWLAARKKK